MNHALVKKNNMICVIDVFFRVICFSFIPHFHYF